MRNRVVLLAVAVLLATGLAWAGGEKSQAGKMDPAAKAAKLQEKLGLTDAQTQQVRAVLEQTHRRYEALRAKAEPGADIKAEKRKLSEEKNAKLKAIFTPEQWTRYEELMAEHHKQKQ